MTSGLGHFDKVKGWAMHTVSQMIIAIPVAVSRSRLPILTIGLTYAVFILLGIVMVHAGNTFALTYRDQLVSEAVRHNPASIAANQGDNVRAALWDFTGNLVLGALPKTISGMAIIFPYRRSRIKAGSVASCRCAVIIPAA